MIEATITTMVCTNLKRMLTVQQNAWVGATVKSATWWQLFG